MKEFLMKTLCGMCGAFVAVWEPSVDYIVICILLVLWDCYEAYKLNKRVKKKYPDSTSGKFQSKKAWVVIGNIIRIFCAIILSAAIEQNVLKNTNIPLTQIVAGAICFIQVWSILENMSSCNDKPFAKICQRIMIDKTERHLNIKLDELRDKKEQKNG